jgi:hypothetical protein
MAFMKGEQGSTLIEAAELSDAGGGGGVRLIGVAQGIRRPGRRGGWLGVGFRGSKTAYPPPPPGSMQTGDAY